MSQHQTVLYDAQGPRARRRTLIGTVLAVLVLLGLAYVVYRRLDEQGQFSMEEWGPLIDPSNENFDSVWRLIRDGIVNTLKAAAVAMVLSIVLGTLIAVARLSLGRAGRLPLIGLVELFRGVPVPAGSHRVRFWYDPLSIKAGLTVSVLALAGNGLLLWWARRRDLTLPFGPSFSRRRGGSAAAVAS